MKNPLGVAPGGPRAEDPRMTRPRVVCHMVASIDGRIVVDGWPDAISATVRRLYEEVHAAYAADGWLCGRVTMEPFAKRLRSAAEVEREHRGPPREDFVAPGEHASFAFGVDPAGRLAWESNDIAGDHVVAVLSDRVSDDHLAFLRERGVSYLLAGAPYVDLPLALDKIGARFGVKTLMLEGGGGINGGMLRAGLVDEVSLLVAPVVDGRTGTPALFDVAAGAAALGRLALDHVERRAGGVLWLRYQVQLDPTSDAERP
jgi:2,5-diamino-6-(ribosylamino)-4(3H)-pyrimidinone 5'-phosphate reductase